MQFSNKEGVQYSADDWQALQAEVDRQGGAILPEECIGEVLNFEAIGPGGKGTRTRTCRCGNQSMAVLVYEPHVPAKDIAAVKARGGGFLRMCLTCDAAGVWPKFAKVVDQPEYPAEDENE